MPRKTRKEYYVRKQSGEREIFNPSKIKRSLEKAGASDEVIAQILEEIEKDHTFRSVHNIHQKVIQLLNQYEHSGVAGRYNLKYALKELGPTGFPFEYFVEEIFKKEGFTTERDVISQGYCVEHELDLVLTKGNEHFFVECKFHHHLGVKSDVKDTLYIKARFDDLEKQWQIDGNRTAYKAPWLVTNTKFTSRAIAYAECVGMHVIGWSYPAKGNLAQLIDKHGLHPITALTSLTIEQKKAFINKGFVLCQQVRQKEDTLRQLGLSSDQIKKIMQESHQVCRVDL